jgi:hypothetical protein
MMGAEAVQGLTESWHVKDVADEDPASIQLDDGRAFAENGSEGIVAHANAKVGDFLVGNEGRTVG